MSETTQYTLHHMVAKQRHEAGECGHLCSFCYTEAEEYLAKEAKEKEDGTKMS